jgi:hypothetical protein
LVCAYSTAPVESRERVEREILGADNPAERKRDAKRSASVFDPVAGMRVMADIQAEGLRAASELLERVVRSEPDGNGRRPRSPAGDYMALVEAWAELTQRFLEGLAPDGPGTVTVDVDAKRVGPAVRVGLEEPAEVWLRNGTSSSVGPLVLSCGDLRNSKGKRLKGAKVRFKPRKLGSLEAGSSIAVKISLVAKDDPRPGVYRGMIQAQGAPGPWLPIEVTVE